MNECALESGGCEHHCTNTGGSFYCTCDDGFNLEPNGKRCRVPGTYISQSDAVCYSIATLQGHLVASGMEAVLITAMIQESVESAVVTRDTTFGQTKELAGVSLIIPTSSTQRANYILSK